MKKIILSIILTTCFVSLSMAQLTVSSTGKVGIGTNGTLQSQFAIGGVGNQYSKAYVAGDGYALQINSLGKSSNMPNNYYGVGLKVTGSARVPLGNIGVESGISGTYGASDNGFAVGVLGKASNGANGYNYGVSGCLSGYSNGAGVFGCVDDNGHSTYISGRYAGYFSGDVQICGNLRMWLHHIYFLGDSDFMQNLQPMGSMLNRVTSLNPVVYKFAGQSDSTYAVTGQEMATVFPHLVNTNMDVNYTCMIPILVKAIKELQAEIEALQSQIPNNCRSNTLAENSQDGITNATYQRIPIANAVLYQNTPNPFSERTTIRFTLPEDAPNAQVCIFDMSGKMLRQIPVNSGMQSIVINGYELAAGMYLYSLVIGGQEVDTKRMILSK